MHNTTRYNDTYTHFCSKSGNTQIYIYKRRRKTALKRFVKNLLADDCYMLKQKLLGLFALSIAIAEIYMNCIGLIDEGGLFLFMLPIGLYTLFTKEKICTF
jgi:hypothetical protein